MKSALIFLGLLKITSDNFVSKATKAHALFSIVFLVYVKFKGKN